MRVLNTFFIFAIFCSCFQVGRAQAPVKPEYFGALSYPESASIKEIRIFLDELTLICPYILGSNSRAEFKCVRRSKYGNIEISTRLRKTELSNRDQLKKFHEASYYYIKLRKLGFSKTIGFTILRNWVLNGRKMFTSEDGDVRLIVDWLPLPAELISKEKNGMYYLADGNRCLIFSKGVGADHITIDFRLSDVRFLHDASSKSLFETFVNQTSPPVSIYDYDADEVVLIINRTLHMDYITHSETFRHYFINLMHEWFSGETPLPSDVKILSEFTVSATGNK